MRKQPASWDQNPGLNLELKQKQEQCELTHQKKKKVLKTWRQNTTCLSDLSNPQSCSIRGLEPTRNVYRPPVCLIKAKFLHTILFSQQPLQAPQLPGACPAFLKFLLYFTISPHSWRNKFLPCDFSTIQKTLYMIPVGACSREKDSFWSKARPPTRIFRGITLLMFPDKWFTHYHPMTNCVKAKQKHRDYGFMRILSHTRGKRYLPFAVHGPKPVWWVSHTPGLWKINRAYKEGQTQAVISSSGTVAQIDRS